MVGRPRLYKLFSYFCLLAHLATVLPSDVRDSPENKVGPNQRMTHRHTCTHTCTHTCSCTPKHTPQSSQVMITSWVFCVIASEEKETTQYEISPYGEYVTAQFPPPFSSSFPATFIPPFLRQGYQPTPPTKSWHCIKG